MSVDHSLESSGQYQPSDNHFDGWGDQADDSGWDLPQDPPELQVRPKKDKKKKGKKKKKKSTEDDQPGIDMDDLPVEPFDPEYESGGVEQPVGDWNAEEASTLDSTQPGQHEALVSEETWGNDESQGGWDEDLGSVSEAPSNAGPETNGHIDTKADHEVAEADPETTPQDEPEANFDADPEVSQVDPEANPEIYEGDPEANPEIYEGDPEANQEDAIMDPMDANEPPAQSDVEQLGESEPLFEVSAPEEQTYDAYYDEAGGWGAESEIHSENQEPESGVEPEKKKKKKKKGKKNKKKRDAMVDEPQEAIDVDFGGQAEAHDGWGVQSDQLVQDDLQFAEEASGRSDAGIPGSASGWDADFEGGANEEPEKVSEGTEDQLAEGLEVEKPDTTNTQPGWNDVFEAEGQPSDALEVEKPKDVDSQSGWDDDFEADRPEWEGTDVQVPTATETQPHESDSLSVDTSEPAVSGLPDASGAVASDLGGWGDDPFESSRSDFIAPQEGDVTESTTIGESTMIDDPEGGAPSLEDGAPVEEWPMPEETEDGQPESLPLDAEPTFVEVEQEQDKTTRKKKKRVKQGTPQIPIEFAAVDDTVESQGNSATETGAEGIESNDGWGAVEEGWELEEPSPSTEPWGADQDPAEEGGVTPRDYEPEAGPGTPEPVSPSSAALLEDSGATETPVEEHDLTDNKKGKGKGKGKKKSKKGAAQLKLQLAEMTAENENLKRALDTPEFRADFISTEMQAELSSYREQIQEQLMQIEQLQQQLFEVQQAHTDSQNEVDRLNEELRRLRENDPRFIGNDELVRISEEADSLRGELNATREKLGETVTQLKTQVPSTADTSELLWQIDALQAQLSQLEKERDSLQADSRALLSKWGSFQETWDSEKQSRKKEREAIQKEREEMLKEREGIRVARDEIQSEREALSEETEAFKHSMDTLSKEKEALESERAAFEENRIILQHQLEDLQSASQAVEQERLDLARQREEMELPKEHASYVDNTELIQLREARDVLESKVSSLTEQLEDAREKFADQERQHIDLVAANETLEARVSELGQQLFELRDSRDAEQQSLKSELEASHAEAADARHQLDALRVQMIALQKEKTKLAADNDRLVQSQWESDTSTLGNSAELEEMREKLRQLQDDIEFERQLHRDVETQLREIQADKSEVEAEALNLQQELESMHNRLSALASEKSDSEREWHSQKEKLQRELMEAKASAEQAAYSGWDEATAESDETKRQLAETKDLYEELQETSRKEVNELLAKMDTAAIEIDKLSTELDASRDQQADLAQEVERLRSLEAEFLQKQGEADTEILRKQDRIDELEAQLPRQNDLIQKLEQEREKLIAELAAKPSSTDFSEWPDDSVALGQDKDVDGSLVEELQSKLRYLEDVVEGKTAEVEQLEVARASLEQSQLDMMAQLQSLESMKIKAKDTASELEHTKMELSDLREQFEAKVALLSDKEGNEALSAKTIDDLTTALQDVRDEVARLQQELEEQRAETKRAKELSVTTKETSDSQKPGIQPLSNVSAFDGWDEEDEFGSNTSQPQQLSSDNETKANDAQSSDMEEQLAEARAAYTKLSEQFNSETKAKEQEIELLQQSIADESARAAKLEATTSSLEQTIAKLQKEVSSLHEVLESKNSTAEPAPSADAAPEQVAGTDEFDANEGWGDFNDFDAKPSATSVVATADAAKKLQTKFDVYQSQSESTISELRSQLAELEEENQQVEIARAQLETEILNLKDQAAMMHEKLAAMSGVENNLADLQQRLDDAHHGQYELQQLRDEAVELAKSLQAKVDELTSQLTDALAELQAQKDREEKSVLSLESEVQDLRTKLDNAQVESAATSSADSSVVSDLQEQLYRREAQLEELSQDLNTKAEMLDQLRGEVARANENVAFMEEQLREKQSMLREQAETTDDYMQQVSQLSRQLKQAATEHQAALEQARAQSEELQAAIRQKEEDIEMLNEDLEGNNEALAQAQAELKRVAILREQDTATMREYEQRIQELEGIEAAYKEEIAELRQEAAALSEKLAAVDAAQPSAGGMIDESVVAARLAELQSKHDVEMQQRLQQLQMQLDSESRANLEDSIEEARAEAQQQALEQMDQLRIKYEAEMETLRSEIHRLASSSSTQSSQLQAHTATLEQQITAKNDRIEKLTAELTNLAQERDSIDQQYKEQVMAADQFMSEATAKRKAVKMLEDKNNQLSDNVARLTSELSTSNAEILSIKEQLQIAKQQLSQSTSSADARVTELTNALSRAKVDHQTLLQNYEQIHSLHEQEMEQLRLEREDETTRSQMMMEDMIREKDELWMKLQAANAEVSKVTSKLQMLNRETDENKYSQSSQFKAMTEEKERLEGQVESMRLSLQAVEDELSVTVARLQSQVQRAESSLEETTNVKNSLLAEVAVLKQQLQETESSVEERLLDVSKNLEIAKKERDALETRVREADSKHSNATSALLQRIEQLQIQNNELTRVRSFDDQLRQQLAEREKQIETLTREKDDLVQRLVEKTQDSALPTEQVVDAKNKLSVQLSELQTVTQRLTIENAKLKERLVLETQPERITKLTTAIEILQREKEDLTAQVNQQGKLIEQLNDQRSDVADAINTATAQAETIKTLRNEKSQLAQFLHAKTVELAQVISEKNQLRNQSSGQANTQHLEMTIAELRAEIRLLKSSTVQHPTPVAANPEPVPSPQKPSVTPTSAPSTPTRTHTPPISVTPERRQSGEIQPPNPLGTATQLPPMQPPEMEDMRPSPTPAAPLPQPEPPKIVDYEPPKKSGWAGSVWNTIWGTD